MVVLSKIKEDVRIVLDHNDVQTSLAGLGEDQLQLDDIIENQVEAAARLTVLNAPRSYVKWSALDAGAGEAVDTSYYAVPVPSDYIRFGAAKMTSWAKAVAKYGITSDEDYTMQQSEFAGVRATRRKPMAFLVEKPEGGNEFQLYPIGTDDDLEYLTYCKQPTLGTGGLDIEDTLYQPFIYMTASLVAEVLKDTDKSNELMTASKAMMAIPEEATTTTQEQN